MIAEIALKALPFMETLKTFFSSKLKWLNSGYKIFNYERIILKLLFIDILYRLSFESIRFLYKPKEFIIAEIFNIKGTNMGLLTVSLIL